jgi:hypothetical protein
MQSNAVKMKINHNACACLLFTDGNISQCPHHRLPRPKSLQPPTEFAEAILAWKQQQHCFSLISPAAAWTKKTTMGDWYERQ